MKINILESKIFNLGDDYGDDSYFDLHSIDSIKLYDENLSKDRVCLCEKLVETLNGSKNSEREVLECLFYDLMLCSADGVEDFESWQVYDAPSFSDNTLIERLYNKLGIEVFWFTSEKDISGVKKA